MNFYPLKIFTHTVVRERCFLHITKTYNLARGAFISGINTFHTLVNVRHLNSLRCWVQSSFPLVLDGGSAVRNEHSPPTSVCHSVYVCMQYMYVCTCVYTDLFPRPATWRFMAARFERFWEGFHGSLHERNFFYFPPHVTCTYVKFCMYIYMYICIYIAYKYMYVHSVADTQLCITDTHTHTHQ